MNFRATQCALPLLSPGDVANEFLQDPTGVP